MCLRLGEESKCPPHRMEVDDMVSEEDDFLLDER